MVRIVLRRPMTLEDAGYDKEDLMCENNFMFDRRIACTYKSAEMAWAIEQAIRFTHGLDGATCFDLDGERYAECSYDDLANSYIINSEVKQYKRALDKLVRRGILVFGDVPDHGKCIKVNFKQLEDDVAFWMETGKTVR